MWCSILFWSLPVLQRRSSPLVASVCSVWSSAWLCLGDWWGWLFGSFNTAAGCFSWELWWLRTGSTVLAILQSARSYRRLSWERWLHPLRLLRPFCWDVVDSSWLPFLQWLYCSLHFFAKDWEVILCVCLGTVQYCWISIVLVIVQLSAELCLSVQYLSYFCEAFPELSWTVIDFPCFTVVKSFTSWYAL